MTTTIQAKTCSNCGILVNYSDDYCEACAWFASQLTPQELAEVQRVAQATRQVETQPEVTTTSAINTTGADWTVIPVAAALTERDLALLRELWEYCDNYGEAADDASVGAVRALNFAEPLRQLIARLESKN